MKTHTSSFKEQIKLKGKEIDSRITFGDTVLGKSELNAVTPSYQGAILKSVMKQLDIDSNVEIPIGTILTYEFGLKVNGEYEYINYGNYVVYSIEKQEDTNSYKITCYDKLLYSMLDYVKLPITYPISIRDYINAVSTALGLTFANRSGTFANYNKQIQADLYDGLGYTFRDVLDELAQVTASTICLNNNDELEIRYITETGDTIDEEFLKDVNVNFGEKFGAVNTIVLSRSGDSDSVYYPSVLPANPYEIKISDNQIMNGNDRADFLPDIYNKLNGLEFYTNDFVSTGICYYDLCDRYSVKVGDTTYSCVMFNEEVLVTQGLEENIYTELPEQTETDYKHASKDDRMINQVYIIAKKNEAEILALVSTTETIQKEINPTKDESGSKIIIEDASNNPLTYLEIEGKSTQETRSGKNLATMNSVTATSTGYLNTSTGYFAYVESGKTYTLSLNISEDNTTTGNTEVRCYTSTSGGTNQGVVTNFNRLNGGGKIVRTFTSSYSGYLSFSASNIVANSEVFTKIQLEEGSNATEYEKYGASPSPDFPSEIESVGYENLFDKDNANILTKTYINVGNKIILTDNARKSFYLQCKSNTDYAITKTKGNYFRVGFTVDAPVLNATVINPLTPTSQNVVLNSEDGNYLVVSYYDSSVDTLTEQEILDNIQIEEGKISHSCIPYDKYGVEVKTIGKNLANSNDSTENVDNIWNFTIGEVKANKNYSLYINVDGVVSFHLKYKGDSETIRSDYSVTGKKVINFTSTKDDSIYFNCFGSGEETYKGMTEIMLVEGTYTIDTIGEYQPYQERITVMQLNAPLRSLPNGVKDIAYIRNNKLYVDRYVGSVVLNGSENSWEFISGSTLPFKYSISNMVLPKNNSTMPTLLSNYYKIAVWNEAGSAGDYLLTANYSEKALRFRNNDYSTLADFKTWLSTNNTEVDYELATPVTEEYGEIEILKTLKGYNNISTTDELLPIINLTYVRDTILSDYVENHVAELKLTENEIKASVESVSSSVDGLNTTINRVEEITNDNSQVINVISTSSSFDLTTGEVREVTTTTGFTFNADGMTIDDGSGFKAEHTANGTYYKDGNSIVGQYTKDGSKQKDLELFGTYSYGKESIDDTPMFVGQLYTDGNGEEGFGHFVNI